MWQERERAFNNATVYRPLPPNPRALQKLIVKVSYCSVIRYNS
jgi:hypothetical protein